MEHTYLPFIILGVASPLAEMKGFRCFKLVQVQYYATFFFAPIELAAALSIISSWNKVDNFPSLLVMLHELICDKMRWKVSTFDALTRGTATEKYHNSIPPCISL